MHRKFLGDLGKSTGVAIVAIALSGCVQATRHSNTMVFGTSTSVGIKVGTDTAQIPAVEIGYNRQEMVIMPLLANIGEASANSNRLTPCNPTFAAPAPTPTPTPSSGGTQAVTTVASANNAIHPCQFVASRREGGNVSSQDSYSVLASFGAEIQGNATTQEAAVGLAQYFATGVAAQLLAASGGAAVVAVGGAAAAAAGNEANAAAAAAVATGDASAIETLFENPSLGEESENRNTTFETFKNDLVAKIRSDNTQSVTGLAGFRQTAEIPAGALTCTDQTSCINTYQSSGDFFDHYRQKGDEFMRRALNSYGSN